MCGIIGYKYVGENEFIQRRGQDHTNEVEINGMTFIHNLLSVTGEFTPQPFTEDNIVVLFNGEIYNHSFNKSDGENIIPLYKKHGVLFPRELDGEWAIALFDYNKNIAVFSTDLFSTKPLWRDGVDFASYESGVGGNKIEANTIQVLRIDTEELIEEHKVYEFDFKNQVKNTYDDWIKAFEESIKKRGKEDCFIGLSSGYDSGSIQAELRRQGIKHKSYAVGRNENEEIMAKREPDETIILTPEQKQEIQEYINKNTEDFKYTIKYNGIQTAQTVLSDPASIGLAAICKRAQKEGRKVYLSGQGADEITSDYSKFEGQGEIQNFGEDLNIWYNFYKGCQESYIAKEEHVAGTFNIETRYPFLDKMVVQEFLWLTPELKNKNYKAPLYEYLIKYNIPFEEGVKRGFTP